MPKTKLVSKLDNLTTVTCKQLLLTTAAKAWGLASQLGESIYFVSQNAN